MSAKSKSIIVEKVSSALIPGILLFALYVFFHGHYSPGGGFQAGVLVGASIILKLLVGTKAETKVFSVTREFIWSCVGVLIFCFTGAYALLAGGNFFDYELLSFLQVSAADKRYFGILIAEVGVLIVVAMTLVAIFHILALSFKEDE